MSNRRKPQNIAQAAAREALNLPDLTPPPLVRPEFPGIDADAWTDLPPAQYPPDTVAFIRRALELGEDLKRVQGFRCDGCKAVLPIVDRHPGYSPRFVDHARILDSSCPGTFVSFGYPDEALPEGNGPAFEFYRPGEPELLGLPDEYIDHVLKGGLILRLAR